ncbi:Bifunctional pantoate ligase/cytidylate kinase [Streptomyces violaceorubidus]
MENGAAPTVQAVIVAIDGPSGTGKSSTSKAMAAQLGLSYLDTGAQYRAITWWMVSNGIDTDDPHAVAAAGRQARDRLRHRPGRSDHHGRRHPHPRRRRPPQCRQIDPREPHHRPP